MTSKKTRDSKKVGGVIFRKIPMKLISEGGEAGKYTIIDGEKYHVINNLHELNKSRLNITKGKGCNLVNTSGKGKNRWRKTEISNSPTQGEQ